jgi:hypothetical protein
VPFTNHSNARFGLVLAFNAAATTTAFWVPITCVRASDAADNVIVETLANADVLDTLLAGVELTTELDTLELASPQATKVSVKTEVVTNLKIFFILKNHLLGTLYIKQL